LSCPLCGSDHEFIRIAEDRGKTIKYKCGSYLSREKILQTKRCAHVANLEGNVKILEDFVAAAVAGGDVASLAATVIKKRQLLNDMSFSTPTGIRYLVESYDENAV